MVHHDHVRLIKKAMTPGRQVWADLGFGEGVFHPFSFETFKKFCQESGFAKPVLLEIEPSRFLNKIYAVVTSLG